MGVNLDTSIFDKFKKKSQIANFFKTTLFEKGFFSSKHPFWTLFETISMRALLGFHLQRNLRIAVFTVFTFLTFCDLLWPFLGTFL